MIETQADIARKLGVSRMTVYRALQKRSDISGHTRKKVMELVNESGYRPDDIARSLVLKKTNTLGLLFPCITHSFFPNITRGIRETVRKKGYHVILSHHNHNCHEEEEEINLLKAKKVDGIIVSPANERTSLKVYRNLKKTGTPFVFIDNYIKGFKCNFVRTDDVNGAYEAVELFIKLGHRRIAHLAGPEYISTSRDRLKGYYRALEKNGIRIDEKLVKTAGFEYEDGERVVVEFLNMKQRPTAIFAVTDPVAIGAYLALKKKGVRVPDDISLIGFAGIREGESLEKPLTTMIQPAEQIGQTAAEILIDEIENKDKKHKSKQIFLKPKLSLRKTHEKVGNKQEIIRKETG